MIAEVASSLAQKFGFPLGHHVHKQADDEFWTVFTVQNARGTKYLALAVADGFHEKAEAQLRDTIRDSSTISVGVIVDSDFKVYRVVRKSFRTGDFDVIASFENIAVLQVAEKLKRSDLKPLTERVDDLFFQIHSVFRDVDGLHAPEALEEICKLIYAKLFDEENATRAGEVLFQRSGNSSVEECAAEIRALYQAAVDDDKAIFSNKIPTYERSRGVFKESLLLSSSALVKATEILQGYDLSASPFDIKGRAFQNVLLPAVRAGMGQYFTPKEVIDLVVSMVQPNVRELIIDPFCGSGHFLTSALDYVRGSYGGADKLFHEFAFSRLHGIEKSDRMVRVAMTDMRLHGDGHSNIRCTDALLPFDSYSDLYRETFDLVITNPPFGVDLPQDALGQLGPFELSQGRKGAVSLEIIALERCIQLLRQGGRLAMVIPDGLLTNKSTQNVRDWLLRKAVVRGIVSLPAETFSPFGANVKTSVLIARKLRAGEDAASASRVFLSEVAHVGYDASGRSAANSDLDMLRVEFLKFIAREGW